MFIKEAYEKRIKKEEEEKNQNVQAARNKIQQIGSIKNEKINYDRQEQYFSKDDVPHKAKQMKHIIKDFTDPDHLGLKKKQWNTSVSVPKNMQLEESHQRKLTKIKLGLLDHPIPKTTEAKIYPGTETRNDFTNWNVSVQVSKKQLKENLNKMTHTALQSTKSIQKNILKTYQNPVQKIKNYNQALRTIKQNEQEVRKTIREQYKFYNPTVSQEKTDAAVFRLLYESKLNKSKNQNIEKFPDFKANLTQTLKSNVKAESYHTGVWQKFKINKKDEVEQFYAWSCCMNEEGESSGCVTKIVDKNKWNLTSFNNY